MTEKELAALLEEDAPESEAGLLSASEGTQEKAQSSSQTVLEMDRWGRRRGKEIAEQWSDLDADEGDGDEVFDPNTVADAHSCLFDAEPRLAENPEDEGRSVWWKQLMDTPEYKKLHQQTCLDNTLSEIGAKSICDQWLEYAAECPEQQEGDPAPGSDEESLQKALDRIRSTSKALQEASETVEAAKDTAEGLGLGDQGGQIDPKELAKYFDMVRKDPFLRDVMKMAGRMRTLCQALQRTKTTHGRDDTVGVELSGDISRLIPSELAQLSCGIDELELLALDRVARGQALSRQYRGLEKLGRGPIVVCVDESGSMRGPKSVAAKALALTMAWLARQQRRWIGLIGFSGGTEGNLVFFPPGREMTLGTEKLIEWITHFYGGGTTLDVPLDKLPFEYWKYFKERGLPEGKTDIIFITDALVHCPTKMRDDYLKWAKDVQAQSYGIVIGQSDPGDLKQVCDRYWCIPNLDLDNEAVHSVLSI